MPPAAGIWHDPIDPAAAVRHREGERDAGRGRIRPWVRRHPGRERTPDGLHGPVREATRSGAGDAAFRIIQNGFQQIGIKVTQRKEDNDAVNTAILGDNNTYNKFDLAMWDWYPCCPVPDFILSVVECSEFGNWSDTGYCNPAYDKMYKEQGLQRQPEANAQKIVYAMQKIASTTRVRTSS